MVQFAARPPSRRKGWVDFDGSLAGGGGHLMGSFSLIPFSGLPKRVALIAVL